MKNNFSPCPLCVVTVFLLLLSFSFASAVNATSVLEVSVDEMLDGCDFVFQGHVADMQTRKGPRGKRIYTHVTFDIIDIIKGSYPTDTIELRFLGGTIGNKSLKVGEMHVPELGENGIYFVESLTRRQVHPLYGWSQGHLLIGPDSRGTGRVMTRDRKRVTALESVPQRRTRRLSRGIARGLQATGVAGIDGGMTTGDFKRKLREMLRGNDE